MYYAYMPRGIAVKVVDRMVNAYHIVASYGCVSTAVVMHKLGATQKQTLYALTHLLSEGRVVKVVLGGVSVWCKDKEMAEEYVKQLKAEVVRLTAGRMYVSPRDLLSLILLDKNAEKVFRHIIPLGRSSVLTYGVISTLLRAVYGKPIRRWKYYTLQTNPDGDVIKIIDRVERGWVGMRDGDLVVVSFKIPRVMLADLDIYVKQMGMTRSDVVRIAIQNMLTEFKAFTKVALNPG
jgi:hypothetical protein